MSENLVTVDDAVYGVPVFRDAFGPQPAIFEQDRGEAFGSGPLSRVSNLWDSKAAPGVNRHLGVSPRLVGLADYSNHDYFSGDTVFATYPHPAAGEATLNLYAVPLPEGGTEERLFFSRTTSDGVFVRFLAAAGLLVQDLQDVEPGSEFDNAHLDDSCYEDYASNLIPRAVSYGADLVDYFLRARLAATAEGTTP